MFSRCSRALDVGAACLLGVGLLASLVVLSIPFAVFRGAAEVRS